MSKVLFPFKATFFPTSRYVYMLVFFSKSDILFQGCGDYTENNIERWGNTREHCYHY